MRKVTFVLKYVCVLLTLVFGYLFYTLYWQWRHQFNEQGSYFDANEAVVYHQDAVFWLIPTLLFAGLTLFVHRVAIYLTKQTP